MRAVATLVLLTLVGCAGNLGYQGMTAEQIKATAGTTTCTQYAGLYGKASTIMLNQQDTRKGATSNDAVKISCGDATMSIDSAVGVPVPPGSTTTTTVTVVPAK